MFSKVWHWFVAMLAGPFAAAAFGGVSYAVHSKHEIVAMVLMVAAGAALIVWPIICLRCAAQMWLDNRREARLERIRIATREQSRRSRVWMVGI